MLNFITYKIKNKKLLNICLTAGVVLLSGFLCIYPMFREGSLNKLLQMLFVESIEENRLFPATVSKEDEIITNDINGLEDINNVINHDEKNWCDRINCPVVVNQRIIYSKEDYAEASFGTRTIRLSYGTIPNMYDYVDLLYGTKAKDWENNDNELVALAVKDGAIPCVISQSTMDEYGLSVGEQIKFQMGETKEKGKLRMVVTGIIEEKEDDNYFWYERLSKFSSVIFVDGADYDEMIYDKRMEKSFYDDALLYDYTRINSDNAKKYKYGLEILHAEDEKLKDNFGEILKEYSHEERSISIILITFVLPIVALLLLFLYMISDRILEMETTEIAMLKSRGVSRGNVIKIYVCQSSLISLFGCIVGIPVGVFMCKLAAGTNAFLSFSMKDVSEYRMTYTMVVFAGLAFVLSILFMSLPVIKLSKLTITDRRMLRVKFGVKPLWERTFFDIILLGISVYFLYNYYKQRDYMATQIMEGRGIDPVLFLDSSLFILACGLLFLRLVGYLIRLVNHIGRKKWKPETYVSFLQIIRNRSKLGFISVFVVMTIAMGVFNANLARTVNENMENRTEYNIGTDIRLQEKWKLTTVKIGSGEILWSYKEPDFARFDVLGEYGVVGKTKVIIDNNTDITIGTKVEKGNTLMAVHTKEFGMFAKLDPNLNDKHWFYYLNELAANPKGVLISDNLAKKYDLKVGDKLKYERYSPIDSKNPYSDTNTVICGIVNAFPGFESVTYERNEQDELVAKDNYLIVANYATVINNCTQTPYQVWMKTDRDVRMEEIKNILEQNNIKLDSIACLNDDIQKQRNSAMIQITNGMFSVGFIVSLLICAVGFLIYWVLTIKEREMIYGIYRAMGMKMAEITKMLVIEQIFSSFLAAVSGGAVGVISTALFAKLIAIVYLPKKHNIPIEIFFELEDAIKIAVIVLITFGICFVIMSRTVRRLNITKALKMGED